MTHTSKRYHEFDALRGFAMLLGIVLHGMLSFMFLPIWPAQDIHQNQTVYGFLLHAIHGFRMPVFFLISGFFTAMMWRKRGAKGLIVHRAKRILIPLIIGTIIVWPLMVGLSHWGTQAKGKRIQEQSTGSDIWSIAKQGNIDGLQQLIEEGADVNGRDSLGVSSLEWAAMYGHPEAVALLVENGADVNARNRQGSTPLHAAACFGRTAAAEKLIELGADPDVANDRGDTPLHAARLDMNIVQFIAGILQMPVDTEAVAVSKRETAVYLQGLETLSAREGTAGNSATSEDRNSLWARFLGDYTTAAFFPLFNHLWFLYYLLWLVGIFLVAAWVREWIPVQMPRWMIATPWCLLWLVPLTLVPQLFMTQTFGADSATGWLPWLPILTYYAVFFGFGALCFGRSEFEEKAGRYWPPMFVAALPVLLVGLHFFEARERGGDVRTHALMSLCAVVYAWLMVFGMIGFFRRFFARESRCIRYLSDSAYWLYLAHLPVIIALQIWVSNWDFPTLPKFLLVCTLTFALLIVTYQTMVRYTFIGSALNGRKIRPNDATSRLPRLQESA